MNLRIAAVTALACGLSLNAGQITFTESMNTSGSLNDASFNNKLVTITMITDTALIQNAGGFSTIIGPATVTVAGFGTDQFTDIIEVLADHSGGVAGFVDLTISTIVLETMKPVFASYALDTSIGPVSARSRGIPGTAYATKGGSLVLNGPFSIDFQSTFTAAATSAPEPSAWAMVLVGFAAFLIRRTRG